MCGLFSRSRSQAACKGIDYSTVMPPGPCQIFHAHPYNIHLDVTSKKSRFDRKTNVLGSIVKPDITD